MVVMSVFGGDVRGGKGGFGNAGWAERAAGWFISTSEVAARSSDDTGAAELRGILLGARPKHPKLDMVLKPIVVWQPVLCIGIRRRAAVAAAETWDLNILILLSRQIMRLVPLGQREKRKSGDGDARCGAEAVGLFSFQRPEPPL